MLMKSEDYDDKWHDAKFMGFPKGEGGFIPKEF